MLMLPVVKSIGKERLLELWPTGHCQVLLVDERATNEVAEDEDEPFGQTTRLCNNQSLGTSRWVSDHPVQLMELHLFYKKSQDANMS